MGEDTAWIFLGSTGGSCFVRPWALWDLRAVGTNGDVTRMRGLRVMSTCPPASLGDAANDWHLLPFRLLCLLFPGNVC